MSSGRFKVPLKDYASTGNDSTMVKTFSEDISAGQSAFSVKSELPQLLLNVEQELSAPI
jgi:hypothetical protein